MSYLNCDWIVNWLDESIGLTESSLAWYNIKSSLSHVQDQRIARLTHNIESDLIRLVQ